MSADKIALTRVHIGIGSNLDRRASIAAGLRELKALCAASASELRASAIYESEAVGFDGPPFFNLVVELQVDSPLDQLREQLHAIESRCGRVRGGEKFAPRTLDLDLLTWGDDIIDRDGLQLPRDEIVEYPFVLRPMAELSPDYRHPKLDQTMAELWQQRARQMTLIMTRVDTD